MLSKAFLNRSLDYARDDNGALSFRAESRFFRDAAEKSIKKAGSTALFVLLFDWCDTSHPTVDFGTAVYQDFYT
ncbi:MAG: hypothetical protein A2Z25_02155 [Planctomycetes bacterium RBG_16_55_9]|nr:MAG: hypothetical protein A2Z25_02155 [Planctomycetes bacterium RBG_16_55_9]